MKDLLVFVLQKLVSVILWILMGLFFLAVAVARLMDRVVTYGAQEGSDE